MFIQICLVVSMILRKEPLQHPQTYDMSKEG